MSAVGKKRIKEFSFDVDVEDCANSVFDHIFANLKRKKEDFELFFYLDKKMIR